MRGPAAQSNRPAVPSSVSVSVVIPAFQAEPWMRDALATVADQILDSAAIEVIVVDDGSTDETASTARGALIDFGLVGSVISQPNRGVSAARNAGWRAARGDWIQFLDVDDRLASAKIATQLGVALTAESGCAVIYSAWQRVVRDGDFWVALGPPEDPAFDEPVRGIIEDRWFGYLGPCLIRRDALAAVHGLDETMSLGEDLDLMLRLAIAGWGFRRAPATSPLYFYRHTPGSLWQRSSKDASALRLKNETEANAERHLRSVQQNVLSDRTRLALAERYMSTYQFSRGLDEALSGDLLTQLAGLRLRKAPGNAPRLARALTPFLGLAPALRAHALFRAYRPAR
jgi:glycosyltransferase involved in cell wall biosynthesis